VAPLFDDDKFANSSEEAEDTEDTEDTDFDEELEEEYA